MIMKIFSFLFILFLLFPAVISGQTYRDVLKVKPVQSYQAMFEYAGKKEYEKIVSTLKYVSTVITSIKEKFGVNCESEIKKAVEKKDEWEIQAALLKLAFYDMKDLLHEIINDQKKSSEVLKTLLKEAYMDFLFISPEIAKKDEKSDNFVKKLFKQGYYSLGTKTPYGDDILVDLAKFAETAKEIEKEITRVFPEFSPPKKA